MRLKWILVGVLLAFGISFAGTTGKISGYVYDAATGDPLPGANVLIRNTSMGAATNADGFYVILNIPPGEHEVMATYIGYATVQQTAVPVNIDLTTQLDFNMKVEAFKGEEIIVTAERKPVQVDIASSQVNISKDEINDLPATDVADVVGMEAGMSGLSVRSGDLDETTLLVDGLAMKDSRTGDPISTVSLSSIEQIMVQSGGFSAEYSDLQSGMVSIVTKEGDTERYNFNANIKYSPYTPKNFAFTDISGNTITSMFDENSVFLRPYLDDDVCWTGTSSGAWDLATQGEYPEFVGWNAVSQGLMNDDDPTNDLSPMALQEQFRYLARRGDDFYKKLIPDYNVDLGLSGPFPFVSKQLGNLRFYTTLVLNQNAYLQPLATDKYNDWTWTGKFTADISQKMKLSLFSMQNKYMGTATSLSGTPGVYTSGSGAVDGGWSMSRLLYPNYYGLTQRYNQMYAATLKNIVNEKTFWEASAEYSSTAYLSHEAAPRDTTTSDIFLGVDGIELNMDERPYGFYNMNETTYASTNFFTGYVQWPYDSTKTSHFQAKYDIKSQVDDRNEVKAGAQFQYWNYNMNYGSYRSLSASNATNTLWHQDPFQFDAYITDKIEYEGFVAQVGVRAEYWNPNTEWYDMDSLRWTEVFLSDLYKPYGLDDSLEYATFPRRRAKGQFHLMPRIGISHPITETSKLYFNYGHMYQKMDPDYYFQMRRYNDYSLSWIGDPELKFERTVSYELGFDQAIGSQYLIHVAAYYKDKNNQATTTTYRPVSGDNYTVSDDRYYQDIRGLEVTFKKQRGDWFRGFVNLNYSAYSTGTFAWPSVYEDEGSEAYNDMIQNTESKKQSKSTPHPSVKANLVFRTPSDLGTLLGNWSLSLRGAWSDGGYYVSRTRGFYSNIIEIRDAWSCDAKLFKPFRFGDLNVSFVLEVNNVFNLRRLSLAGQALGSSYGLVDGYQFDHYFESLHFPEAAYAETDQDHISPAYYPEGTNVNADKYLDYRPAGVDYQPMSFANNLTQVTDPSVIYYVESTDAWTRVVNGAIVEVPDAEVKDVIETNAYIDNPPNTPYLFLYPRDVYVGLQFSIDL
jgi:outer membrane receptor protein involved in Fe transport